MMNDQAYETPRIVNVDNSLWRSLYVFAEIAGKWWLSIWALTLLSGVISFGLTVANIQQFPTSIWVGLLAAGLIVAPIISFHHLRIQRDKFKDLWDDKHFIISVLSEVEELRSEAAKLQIEGKGIEEKYEVNDWVEKVSDWRKRAIDKLNMLHPAEAGNFTTLGIFDAELTHGAKLIDTQHQSELVNLIRRIRIMSDIRDRWTTRRS